MNRKEIEEFAKKLCKTAFDGEYYGVDYDDIVKYIVDLVEEWLKEKGFKSE